MFLIIGVCLSSSLIGTRSLDEYFRAVCRVRGKRSLNTRGIFARHTSCDSHLRNFKWAYISSIFLLNISLAVDGPILNWYAISSMSRSPSRILLNGESLACTDASDGHLAERNFTRSTMMLTQCRI